MKTQLVTRLQLVTITCATLFLLNGCASGPMDPRHDNGIASTIGGTIGGGYDEYHKQQKGELDQSYQDGADLQKRYQTNKIQLNDSRRQLAILRSDVGELEREISSSKKRLKQYMARSQRHRNQAMEYEKGLGKLEERVQDLDTLSNQQNVESSQVTTLEEELHSLKRDREQLEAKYATMLM